MRSGSGIVRRSLVEAEALAATPPSEGSRASGRSPFRPDVGRLLSAPLRRTDIRCGFRLVLNQYSLALLVISILSIPATLLSGSEGGLKASRETILAAPAANVSPTVAPSAAPSSSPVAADRPSADKTDTAPIDSTPEWESAVRRLLRRLDADELAQRDSAEMELIRMGPAVLPVLRGAEARLSPEARTRVGRIVQQLQRIDGLTGAQASIIDLEKRRAPVSKILAELERQSGNRIVDYRPQFHQVALDPTVELQFGEAPFWQALDETLDAAKLTVYAFGTPRAICVVARPEGHGPRRAGACYRGPFRFEAVALRAQRNPRQPSADGMTVEIELSWEPRVQPIVLRHSLADLRAKLDTGELLASAQQAGSVEIADFADRTAQRIQLPLSLPPRSAKRLSLLQGRLHAVLPGRPETFVFEGLGGSRPIVKRGAAAVAVVEQSRQRGDQFEVRLSVRFDDPGEALATHRGWVFRNPARLRTADGRLLSPTGAETVKQSLREVGISYSFEYSGEPGAVQFIYQTPTILAAADFDYELADLPLP